jgi:hypothetical protein
MTKTIEKRKEHLDTKMTVSNTTKKMQQGGLLGPVSPSCAHTAF